MDPAVRYLILIIILVLLSAFFSSAETALMSVNKIKMRTLAEAGNRSAKIVLRLTDNSAKMLSTILIGNNIVNLSASSLATIFMQTTFHNLPVSIATGVLTIVILIFGEIVPKSIATLYADRISLIYARIIYLLYIVLTPIIFLLNIISRGIMRIFGMNPDKKHDSMTEDEFLTVIDVGKENGVLEDKEHEMIENIVDFGDSLAKDIMVPRIDVEFIEDTASYDEVYSAFSESNFSRLPVFHESTDNVTGVLFLKDFFNYKGHKETFKPDQVARNPYFTFEFKKTSELLTELRSKKLSVAIVLDEYGATAGLITTEDLLEEIVGEIRDEYDTDEEDEIKKISDTEFVVDGTARLDEINEITGLNIETDEYDSIAGHLLSLFERIPEAHDEVSDDKAKYLVLMMDKNRIDKIKIFIKEKPAEEE